MKKMAISAILLLLCICTISTPAQAADYLVPVGQVVGLELWDNTVTVAAFDEALGQNAKAAGLQVGDQLLTLDGKTICCAQDAREALEQSQGQIRLTVSRKGKTHCLKLQPQATAEGPKLGIYLKQGITGIGTITWYDPQEGTFGTLGHGVNRSDGQLLQMVSGRAYKARVASVRPGKAGAPGQLRGAVEGGQLVGQLTRNTVQGVFGKSLEEFSGQALPVADPQDVKLGAATIRSTVSGDTVREYSVEILKIYPNAKSMSRNLLIKVTDPELLSATGGIVQGMSGSPIIQNGKLIGAITHVLVNDPTTGYGIFIENMLDAAA